MTNDTDTRTDMQIFNEPVRCVSGEGAPDLWNKRSKVFGDVLRFFLEGVLSCTLDDGFGAVSMGVRDRDPGKHAGGIGSPGGNVGCV
jgi:hypothetical protein